MSIRMMLLSLWRYLQAYLKWDIEIEKIDTSYMVDYFAKHYKKVVSIPSQLVTEFENDSLKVTAAARLDCLTNGSVFSSIGRVCVLRNPIHTLASRMQKEYPVLYEFQAVKQSKLHEYDSPRMLSITKHLLIESSFNDIVNVHRYFIECLTLMIPLDIRLHEP